MSVEKKIREVFTVTCNECGVMLDTGDTTEFWLEHFEEWTGGFKDDGWGPTREYCNLETCKWKIGMEIYCPNCRVSAEEEEA